jgi:hypothetical protein
VRGDVGVEVVRDQVIVTMLFDRGCKGGEGRLIAKSVVLDGVENALQLGVQLEVAVEVTVAKVLDVFSKVAEEEDVLLSNFTSDFNL